MSQDSSEREEWSTRVAFILAAVGSAVGLGNIWRFPFITGENGGAGFLLVYLVFIVVVGFPAILVEFVIGRHTERNPVGAMQEIGRGAWQYVGWVFVVATFVIMSYYSVIAGWTIRYTVLGLQDGYMADIDAAASQFGQLSSGLEAMALHGLFLVGIVAIVGLGIRQGIELAVKLMVPAIIAIVLGLAAWASTLSGASEGYSFYLEPDFGRIAAQWTTILPDAAGQAFFTLSLGFGIMITYASYIDEDRNLAEDGAIIIGFDTAIAVLVGLIVFPILFTAGVDPGEPGPGAIFVSLSAAFGDLSLGWLAGTVFFGTVIIAALSSAISLTEVVVSYAVDEHGMDRLRATVFVCAALFVLGLAPAYDIVLLSLYDGLMNGILLLLGGLLISVYVSWLWSGPAVEELGAGIGDLGPLGPTWIWLVRVPVVIVIVVSLWLGIVDYVDFLTGDFADWLSDL
ncbi:neurotransmitter:Na+ symporter, NSS family [Halovenus aranensis]|uniref:Transporter n=1 Tax=Halovenus aranensis TaxID=890420 RepID=A0A1G8UUM1_9EURY|nr:sodium-dependent transporter [Halovenus aranensis]SDJ56640.1 neurotransmitter:Na+ symporter, NSS family [Halovenus aranensis]